MSAPQTHFEAEQAVGDRVRAEDQTARQAAASAGFRKAAEENDAAKAQAANFQTAADTQQQGPTSSVRPDKNQTADDAQNPEASPLGKFGHNLKDRGYDISVVTSRHGYISARQAEEIVQRALQKGWTKLYVYGEWGMPNMKAANEIQAAIIRMGVQNRISCDTSRWSHFKRSFSSASTEKKPDQADAEGPAGFKAAAPNPA